MNNEILNIIDIGGAILIFLLILKISFKLKKLERKLNEANEKIDGFHSSNEIKNLQLFSLITGGKSILKPEVNEWILKSENIEKVFEPGKITSVKNIEDNTEIQYQYIDDSIICTSSKDNVITSRIKYNLFGSPIEGNSFNEDGSIKDTFVYNKLGQVEQVERR